MIEETIEITISGKANVDWIRGKMRSEEFASETDVVAHSIALLREEDAEYERWLVEVIRPRYDRHKAEPSSAIPYDEAVKYLEEGRKERAHLAS